MHLKFNKTKTKMSTEFVIEVYNLKTEHDNILKNTIQKVFKKKLKIDISADKLDIEDCGDTKTATVYLHSTDEAQFVTDGINNNGFKLTQIAKQYKQIYANRVQSKRHVNVYVRDENIGDETRYREFKEGGGNIDNFLRTGNTKSLAHYACGFVNNQKDGIIYIGVDDDDDMYVLEIKFYTVDKFDKLYRVDGKVYEKLDASLSRSRDQKRILDWEEQIRHKQKNDELQEKITKYEVDKAKNEHMYHLLIAKKENEIYSLQREKSKLVKEKKTLMDKSKVCVIL